MSELSDICQPVRALAEDTVGSITRKRLVKTEEFVCAAVAVIIRVRKLVRLL
jgi:hypothetical protein